MANPFDQFDEPVSANPFDQFDGPEKKADGGDFLRGAKESFQQLPQLGYGILAGVGAAAENVAGEGGIATGIKRVGIAGYKDWGDTIAKDSKESDSWDYSYDQAKQGNFGSLVDWLQHGLGYVGGQAIQTLATGGIGYAGGKFAANTAAKQIAEGMVTKEAARLTAENAAAKLTTEQIAKQATANVAAKFAAIGQTSALAANAVGMEGGEIFGGLTSENADRALTGSELGKAFIATLGAGGLEFVGDKLGLDIMLGKSALLKPAEKAVGIGGRAARGIIAGGLAAPVEGGTEFGQTLLEEYGKGKDPMSAESMKQAREAAALGTLGGMAIGGVGGAIRGPKVDEQKPPDAKPADPLLIGNTPDPLIGFPGGTVGRRSEVEAYVNKLPEDQRVAARAKLMGMGARDAKPDPADILAAPDADSAIATFTASLTDTDMGGLMGQDNPLMTASRDMQAQAAADEADLADLAQSEGRNLQVMRAQLEQDARKQADLDALQATGTGQYGIPIEAKPAVEAAATVEAPTAMQLAMQRAQAAVIPNEGQPLPMTAPRPVEPPSEPIAVITPQRQPDILPGDISRNDGKPFQTENGAKLKQREAGGVEKSDIIPVAGGFVVRPKPNQEVQSVQKADQAVQTETQRQEPAAGLAPIPASIPDPVQPAEGGAVPVKAQDQRLIPVSKRAPAQRDDLTDDETTAEFERLYQEDVKADIRRRLGMEPPAKEAKPKASAFRTFLRKYGINPQHASDITGERGVRANNRLPATFRRNGLGLDELALRAVESGYLTQADLESDSDNGGTNKLMEMIQAEIRGERQETTSEAGDSAEAQLESVRRAELEDMATALGIPFDAGIDPMILASMVSRVQRALDASKEPKGSTKADRVRANAVAAAQRIEAKRQKYERELEEFAKASIREQNAFLEVLMDDDGTPVVNRLADQQADDAWNELLGAWEDQNGQTETPAEPPSRQAGTPDGAGAAQRPGDAQEGDSGEQRGSDQGQEKELEAGSAEIAEAKSLKYRLPYLQRLLDGEALVLSDAFMMHLLATSLPKSREYNRMMLANNGDLIGIEFQKPNDGKYPTKNEKYAVALPDASRDGKWRVSYFDQNGFSSHESHTTREQAQQALAQEGFTIQAEGTLDRLAATDDWARGTDYADLIMDLNRGAITHAQFIEKQKSMNDSYEAKKAGGLTAPTRADVLRQQAQAEAEAQRKEQGGDKPSERKVTGDTPDLFNPQGSIFDQPAEPEPAQPMTTEQFQQLPESVRIANRDLADLDNEIASLEASKPLNPNSLEKQTDRIRQLTQRKRELLAAGATQEAADLVNATRSAEPDPATQATTILDAANITGKDRLDILKDVKSGALTPGEVQAAFPGVSPPVANESPAEYDVSEPGAPYETDLFGQPVPAPAGRTGSARPASAGVRGNVQPSIGVQDTPAPAGEYFASTLVGSEVSRELGASRITKPEHAAQATTYLYKSAVERLDGIVTDAAGKPLAIVGGFKGALARASVYPATIMAEAVRIPGAARIWFSHNHPSGNPELSDADRRLGEVLSDVFYGSGIEPMGMLAIGSGRFSHIMGGNEIVSRDIPTSSASVSVPVIERTLAPNGVTGVTVSSPSAAKQYARDFYDRSKKPGLILLNTQNSIIGWVPITDQMTGELRGTGGLNAIYRAISESNAGGAIIVHGGELGFQSLPRQFQRVTPSENIAAALAKIDVRPLDSIEITPMGAKSTAESGLNVASGPVYARSTQGRGVNIDDAKAVVASVREALPTAPTIYIMESVAQAPADLRKFIKAAGAENDVDAAYHNGEIYVFPANIPSIERMQFVLAHHEIRHHGLASMLGPRKNAVMLKIHESNPKIRALAAEQVRKGYAKSRILATEEALADMPVADLVKLNGFDRIVAAVREWLRGAAARLRRAGLGNIADAIDAKTWTDKDVVALIARAEGVSRGGSAKYASEGTVFGQDGDMPAFYSALTREINANTARAQPAMGWASTIQGLVKAGKIKQDEVDWSGVLDWLRLQGGKVTREQLVAFLDANGVRVEETVLGGGNKPPGYDADLELLSDNGLTLERNPEDPSMVAFMDENGDLLSADELAEEPGLAKELVLAAYRVQEAADADKVPTRYANYQLPGGSNYREVLLTLPTGGPSQVEALSDAELRALILRNDSNAEVDDTTRADLLAMISNMDMSSTDIAKLTGKNTAQYKSGHWDQPNVLAHIRVNDRVDVDGKRVLFVEEIQSDWGQAGKKQGFDAITPKFVPQVAPGERRALIVAMTEAFRDKLVAAGVDSATATTVAEKTGHDVLSRTTGMVAEYQDLLAREDSDRQAERASKIVGIPSAPFVTKTDAWLSLAIKRIVKMAADGGYDRVAFVNGEQSAERYDLSKQVRSIVWTGRGNDTEKRVTITPNDGNDIEFMVQPDGAVGAMGRGSIGNEFDGKRLDDIVGKDVAERIMGDPYGDMRGNGLKVGGEGMKAFYDKIVPNTLKDVLRKVGGGALEMVSIGTHGKHSSQGVVFGDTAIDPATARVEKVNGAWRVVVGDKLHGTPFSTKKEAQEYIAANTVRSSDQTGFSITPAMREKAAGGLPMFDRNADLAQLEALLRAVAPGRSETAASVRDMVSPLSDKWSIPITVVQRPDQLPVMAPSDARGLYHNGAIYLVASNLNSRAAVMRTLGHEAIAHHGLREMLGDDGFSSMMRQINMAVKAGNPAMRKISEYVRRTYVDEDGKFELTPEQEADEIAARAVEDGIDPASGEFRPGFGWLKGVFAKVAQFLRDLGITIPMSNTELQGVLVNSMRGLEAGAKLQGQGKMAAAARKEAMARKGAQTDSAEFKAWFKDSKVVDADGKPLVVYHGTDSDFATFNAGRGDLGKGIYFASAADDAASYASPDGRGANVMPVYVSIQNPYYWTKEDRNKSADKVNAAARRAGHDGIIRTWADSDEKHIIAFDPAQVKSAIGNNGDFDPANPDIRFARSVVTGATIPQAWQAPDPSKMDDFLYTMQDKHIDTKRVVTAVRDAIGGIADNLDPYLQEELYHGRAAKATKDFLEQAIRPLMVDMQARGVEMSDFEEYLHNRHAERRNEQVAKVNPNMPDGGSGIKTADARAYLAGLPAAKRTAYQALARRVDQMNRDTRALLVSSGLEKQSTIDAWQAAYGDEYVPLMREEMDNGAMGIGQGFSVRGSSSKRAMGSDKPVANIMANIALQREKAITRAEKRRIGEALYGMVLSAPNPDFWFAVDPALEQTPAQITATSIQLISMGLNPIDAEAIAREPRQRYIDPKTGQVAERINPVLRSADNVLAVRIDGEDKYVFFNAKDDRALRMAKSLKNLDSDQLGVVMGNVAKMTRYFAAVNTQFNPVFGVVNLTRDIQTALLNLQSTRLAGKQADVMKHVGSALRGIYIDLRDHRAGKTPTSTWAGLFEEFQREGGATGYRDMYANAKERADAIADELKKVKQGKAMELGRGVFGWLSDYNESMENAVRLATYKVAKEQGMSAQQAASIAKNLTVNFNRKGQVALQAGAMYAFFNAAVQGTARLAQTMFEGGKLSATGKKIMTGGLLLGSMQALLLAAAGYDDEEPPDFVRERSLVLPIGGDKYISIPMPLGFHVIPNLARIPTEWALGGFRDTPKRLAQLVGLFADAFNPIGSAGLSLQTLAPTIIDPLAALAENRDWTGKPIAKKDFNSMQPTAGHTRAKDTATPWARAIAYGVNWVTGGTDYKPGMASPTPDQIDYLIGQATGGVGREASKLSQVASSTVSGEEMPLYKIPLLGRFVGTTAGQAAESGRFYGNLKEIGEHDAELSGLKKDRRMTEYQEYLRENPQARLVPIADRTYREVSKLIRMKRDAIKAGASAERVKMLDQQITSKMRAFNERVRRMQEPVT